MTFRWYGEGNDRIKLSDIKQIPGVKDIVWALRSRFGIMYMLGVWDMLK